MGGAIMQPTDTHPIQHADASNDGDVLSAGEAALDRAQAVSRQIAERVRELTGHPSPRDDFRPD
jgi:hypothetical protein